MSASLEKRVAALEKQVARLQHERPTTISGREWIDDLYGRFANDPVFEHAMKLGREYRKSLRPGARKVASRR